MLHLLCIQLLYQIQMDEMLINGLDHYVQLILNYYVKMEQEKQLNLIKVVICSKFPQEL